jgi:hypothetical protein
MKFEITITIPDGNRYSSFPEVRLSFAELIKLAGGFDVRIRPM